MSEIQVTERVVTERTITVVLSEREALLVGALSGYVGGEPEGPRGELQEILNGIAVAALGAEKDDRNGLHRRCERMAGARITGSVHADGRKGE